MGRLGELERAVMETLWSCDDWVTVRKIYEELAERGLAYTTVMTVLSRLADKGFVRRKRDGRAWLYAASGRREQYVAELMMDALGQTGDRGAALVRFAGSVSEEEAELLRKALPRRRRS